jgi:hypothetical protein
MVLVVDPAVWARIVRFAESLGSAGDRLGGKGTVLMRAIEDAVIRSANCGPHRRPPQTDLPDFQ